MQVKIWKLIEHRTIYFFRFPLILWRCSFIIIENIINISISDLLSAIHILTIFWKQIVTYIFSFFEKY